MSEPYEFTEIHDHTCPVCGRNFIPAPFHLFRVSEKRVCSWHCQLRGEREGITKSKGASRFKPVSVFDLTGNFLKDFASPKDAGRAFRISEESIRKCCRGETSSAGGYVFRYKK